MNKLMVEFGVWSIRLGGVLLVFTLGVSVALGQDVAEPDAVFATEEITVDPVMISSFERSTALAIRRKSPALAARLQAATLRSRELIARRPENQPFGTEALPAGREDLDVNPTERSAGITQQSQAVGQAFPPGDLSIPLDQVVTVNLQEGVRSSLAEPAHANLGEEVFYTGNTFAAFSTDEGITWTERLLADGEDGTFSPRAPFTGAILCCDQDVEYSPGSNVVFWLSYWLNTQRTTSAVQIAVLRSPASAPRCIYNFQFGTVKADYPHLGLSNDFLYFSSNNIQTRGTPATSDDFWTGSQMQRLPLDEIADCRTINGRVFTWSTSPQRVFVPVEGASDIMYWGFVQDNTQFRVFEWAETSTSVLNFLRTISFSRHVQPDCSSGRNNVNWFGDSTSFSQTGFRVRGWIGQPNRGGGRHVLGWLWNATRPVQGQEQAFVRSAVFDAVSKNLLGEPHIFSDRFCFGYPDVATTERGHPAVVLALSGWPGSNDSFAIQSAVLLGDDTVTSGGPFGDFFTVAAGTHNAARFGDYFTIQQQEPCHRFLTASSYVLRNSANNAEHHYAAFGRNRDLACFDRLHSLSD